MKAPCWLALAVGCWLAVSFGSAADTKQPGTKEDINVVHDQVTALYLLYQLQATPAQLEALAKLAADTAAKPRPRKAVKVSEALRKAMTDLRAALAANDEDKIIDLFDALEDIKEKEDVDFDDEVSLTAAARQAAPGFLKKLTPRQLASFLADYAEEFPDPQEKMVEAFDEIRKLPAKEWQTERDDVAEQVGWLVAGLDEAADKKVRAQVVALLNKVRALKDADYKLKREELEQEAQSILGDMGPTDVLAHFAARSVAELLSNPQLAAALVLRVQKSK